MFKHRRSILSDAAATEARAIGASFGVEALESRELFSAAAGVAAIVPAPPHAQAATLTVTQQSPAKSVTVRRADVLTAAPAGVRRAALVSVAQTRQVFYLRNATGDYKVALTERFDPDNASSPDGRFVNVAVVRGRVSAGRFTGSAVVLNKNVAFSRMPEVFPEAVSGNKVNTRSLVGDIFGGVFGGLRDKIRDGLHKLVDKLENVAGEALHKAVDKVIQYGGKILDRLIDTVLGGKASPTVVKNFATSITRLERALGTGRFIAAPERLAGLMKGAVTGDRSGAALNAFISSLKNA